MTPSFFQDAEEFIKESHAMAKLGFSRHTFEKAQKQGLFKSRTITSDKGKDIVVYSVSELNAFMATEEYRKLDEGVVDPRNTLNDLTGKEWLPETKSYFFQKGLGADHPDAQIEKLHPAPYSF